MVLWGLSPCRHGNLGAALNGSGPKTETWEASSPMVVLGGMVAEESRLFESAALRDQECSLP